MLQGTAGGEVICFSACLDEQTAADTNAFSAESYGAMTYCFIAAVTKGHCHTYGELLVAMRQYLEHGSVDAVPGSMENYLRRASFASGGAPPAFAQLAQMSSDKPFNMNMPLRLSAVTSGAASPSMGTPLASNSPLPTLSEPVSPTGTASADSPPPVESPPVPAQPVAPVAPAAAKPGRKRALVIGVSYFGTPMQLDGTANDALAQCDMLDQLGYGSDLRLLVETGNRRAYGRPDRQTILECLGWLVEGARAGDQLFLHYSGHGAQKTDRDGDEGDGKDEALIPLDYQTAGPIVVGEDDDDDGKNKKTKGEERRRRRREEKKKEK